MVISTGKTCGSRVFGRINLPEPRLEKRFSSEN
jgi:hypothetical protein